MIFFVARIPAKKLEKKLVVSYNRRWRISRALIVQLELESIRNVQGSVEAARL